MADIKLTVDTTSIQQQLDRIEARLMTLSDDFASFRTELDAKLAAIDDAMEALRAQVVAGQDATQQVEAVTAAIADARQALANVNPEDPSGDDTPPAA